MIHAAALGETHVSYCKWPIDLFQEILYVGPEHELADISCSGSEYGRQAVPSLLNPGFILWHSPSWFAQAAEVGAEFR